MKVEQDDSANQMDKRKNGAGSSAPLAVHKTEYKNQRGGGTVVLLVVVSALATILLFLALIIDQFPRLIGLLFS